MQIINLKMVRGDTLRKNITFYNKATGVVIDITGWMMFFTVKRSEHLTSLDDTSAVIKKTETIANGASGIWSLVILPDDTKDVQAGNYKYDIQYKKPAPDEDIKTVTIGDFEIEQDVTKRATDV